MTDEKLYTVSDAADVLGCSSRWVYDQIHKSELKVGMNVGFTTYILTDEDLEKLRQLRLKGPGRPTRRTSNAQ